MSVLIIADLQDGHLKKSSNSVIIYGSAIARQLGTEAYVLVLGTCSDDLSALGNFGASKVYQLDDVSLAVIDPKVYTQVIADVVSSTGARVVVFGNNPTAKAVAPGLSAKLGAGLVAGACALPDTSNGFTIKKTVFSGKAFATVSILTEVKIITLQPNSVTIAPVGGIAQVEKLTVSVPATARKVTGVKKTEGEVPLTEADVVVSGGRGMKGPEHWGILLDLAKALKAGTACSRPVGDAHWRPHHEHVGQTGVQIAPNLYFALGISGAIQHLAGVNRSKVIVVINKDPEAPFFKAADYGIVGDLFEVVPRLTAAIEKLHAEK